MSWPGNHRPMPDDFRELAPTLTLTGAVEHYRTGERAVRRWHAEAGTQPAKARPVNSLGPAPAWVKTEGHLPLTVLNERYGVTQAVLQRWRNEVGVKAAPRLRQRKPRAAKLAAKPVAARSANRNGQRLPLTAPRDTSFAGTAAEDLKRAGYQPVCRARVRDPKADPDAWIVGRRIFTTDEMMQLAAKHARPHAFTTSTGASAS